MTLTATDPAIHPAQQAVLDLFCAELAALKFPDVDRAVLEAAAGKVHAAAAAVQAAEEALAAARGVLAEGQEGLLQKCQRALAYARIYAEEDAGLSQKVEAIALPRAGKRGRTTELPAPAEDSAPGAAGAPRRRGRPPKAAASGALFADDGAAEAEPPRHNGSALAEAH